MELLEYLVNKFGPATAKKVYDKIEQVLKSISLYPDPIPPLRNKKDYGNVCSANKPVFTTRSTMIISKLFRAPLKIQMACGGETSRNSAAHLTPVGKQAIGVG